MILKFSPSHHLISLISNYVLQAAERQHLGRLIKPLRQLRVPIKNSSTDNTWLGHKLVVELSSFVENMMFWLKENYIKALEGKLSLY